MKIKPLLLLLLVLPLVLPAQTTVQWSDSIVVTATPNAITAPRVTLLPDGSPLVTWGQSSNPAQIWCSRFENGAFSTPVGVVKSPAVPSLFGFGGYDVAVSGSRVFVVFEQSQQGILLATSVDGGLSFGSPSSVQGPVSGGFSTLSSVTVDGKGNPVVSYILDKNGASYQVRRSTNGGFTFGSAATANAPAPGGAVCECCTSDLVASGDSVWMVFRNNNSNIRDIWVSRSTDLAASFTAATDVDATNWQLGTCPIAGPRMARAGDSLLTVWMSAASGTSRVYLSTLHAGTMQAGQQLGFPASSPQTAQTLADVTALGDTVGVAFLEKSKEIVFCHSTQGAAQLSTHCQRFALPNHTLQYPSLAFRNGVFHLVYADATADNVLYRQGRLTQSSPTGEPPAAADWGFSVFPNPASRDGFWVKSETHEMQEVALLDVFGKKIWGQKNCGREAAVPTEGFPKGVYFLKIKTARGEVSRAVVVR